MSEIERLAEALYRADHPDGDFRRVSTWLYEGRVRAILRAMRDQPEVGALGATEKALQEPVNRIRIEPMQSQLRAYIDHILSEP